MTILLSVQGLTKGFGPRKLFTDLSLDLRAGERIGLIGPNGSGEIVAVTDITYQKRVTVAFCKATGEAYAMDRGHNRQTTVAGRCRPTPSNENWDIH